MIYAVIIIVALAIAFVILIRRLPEAMAIPLRKETPEAKLNFPAFPPAWRAGKWPSFRRPQLRWPKLHLPTWLRSVRRPKPAPIPPLKEAETTPPQETFWADSPAPTVEPETTERVAEARPERTKRKDLIREAEDLFAVKDYRKAERLYLKLATEDPRNAKIYSRLGIIYLAQKNHEDARDALRQAIKLEPHAANRHFNLALAYLELGSFAKAISSMEAALKYDPSNRKYRKMLDEMLTGRASY